VTKQEFEEGWRSGKLKFMRDANANPVLVSEPVPVEVSAQEAVCGTLLTVRKRVNDAVMALMNAWEDRRDPDGAFDAETDRIVHERFNDIVDAADGASDSLTTLWAKFKSGAYKVVVSPKVSGK
jgi:hypothetical protein